MSVYADMVDEARTINAANDSIVIRKYNSGIVGGRTLDMTGFTDDVIRAGHVVIQSVQDESIFKPLPVKDGAYDALPENFKYVGVVVATKPKDDARVGIMYDGEVNDIASPYPVTDAIKTALRTGEVNIIFKHD